MAKDYIEIKARVAPEFHSNFKAEAARRRTNIKAAMIAAIEAWLGVEVAPVEETGRNSESRNCEWHEKLDLILNHGEEMDVVGIQANLNWGAEAVSRKGRQRRTG